MTFGNSTYEFTSDAEGQTGAMTAYSNVNPSNRIHVFIFKNNTAQWVQNLNGHREVGGYETRHFYGGKHIYHPGEDIDQNVAGWSGLDLLLRRGVNELIDVGWKPQAIESDGLGPVDLLIGVGSWKVFGRGFGLMGKGAAQGGRQL